MTSRTKTLLGSLAMAGCIATPLAAQEIDVRAGETNVQADRDSVQVDTGDRARRTRVSERINRRDASLRSQQMDMQIANWLATDQEAIVELAQFGLQRTKTPEVRQLAQTIVRDHKALHQKLEQYAESSAQQRSNVSNPNTDDQRYETRERNTLEQNAETRQRRRDVRDEVQEAQEDLRENRRDAARDASGIRGRLENLADRVEDGAERLADRAERELEEGREAIDRRFGDSSRSNALRQARSRTAGRNAAMRGGSSPWVDVHQQISDRLTDMARQQLEQSQGGEFDAALIGMLTAAHMEQEATMEVLSQRASGDLKQTLDQAVQTIRQHRQTAEQVMQQIK